MDDTAIRRMVLPKLKMVYETNPNDLKIVLNILACLEIILHRLEKQQIIEDVLPLIWIVNQTDPEVIARIAGNKINFIIIAELSKLNHNRSIILCLLYFIQYTTILYLIGNNNTDKLIITNNILCFH